MKKKEPLYKIRLFTHRSMGEKVNATFDFVKENWRVWLKYMLYFLLPVAMLQGIGIDTLIDAMANDGNEDGIVSGLIATYFFICFATSQMCAVTLTLLKIYNDREQGLKDITFGQVWPQLWRNGLRMFGVGVMFALFVTPVLLIANVILLLVPMFGNVLSFALLLPLFVFPVVYIYERPIGFFQALFKGIKLGFSQWIALVFVGIVMMALVLMLTMVSVIPWSFIEIIKYELFNDISWVSLLFEILAKVLSVANCFVIHLAMSFYVLTIAFHYGSVAETRYDASIEDDINNFENL